MATNLPDPTWNTVGWTAQYNWRGYEGASQTPDNASSVDQTPATKQLNNVNGT
jgi:hypothetical protein